MVTATIRGQLPMMKLHENANELFRSADTLLFGRKTYQFMESGSLDDKIIERNIPG